MTVYIIVALVNYSVVQQIAGNIASAHFSKEWNTNVSIKSVNFNILNHITLRGIELYTPEGDSVYIGEKITIRFDELPITSKGIKIDRVYMKNAYYCLEKYPDSLGGGINLNFIINHYKKEKDDTDSTHNRFVVSVNQLVLRNIEYQMYLPGYQDFEYKNGVNVKAMHFKNINARMRNIRVDADYVTTFIERFSADEESGFSLENLTGYAYVSPCGISMTNMDLKTDYSHLKGNTALLYNSWDEMSDYLNTVHMLAEFKEGSYGGLKDATYWAPMLWGFDAKVDIQGNFYGTVADMHTDYVKLKIEDHTSLALNGYIVGLPNMKETIIKGSVNELETNIHELAKVKLPDSWPQISLPSVLQQVKKVNLSATFIGTIYEFYANCYAKTNVGNIMVNADVYQNESNNQYMYEGNIMSPRLNIAALLPNKVVTSTGVDMIVSGEGFDFSTMTASMEEATLFNTTINGNTLEETKISASLSEQTIEATIGINDTNIDLKLYANANLHDSTNTYTANINIGKLNLSDFGILKTEKDTNIMLSTQITANIEGNEFDDLCGNILLENTKIKLNDNDSIYTQTIAFAARELNNYKNITLNCSDFLDFETKGYFEYSDFATITQKILNSYVPNNYNPFYLKDKAENIKPTDAEFNFMLQITDTSNLILSKIVPGLFVAENTVFEGSYNYTESLKFKFNSTLVALNSLVLDNLTIDGQGYNDAYTIKITSPKFFTENITFLENIDISLTSAPTNVKLGLDWVDNKKVHTNFGDINIDIENDGLSNYISIRNSEFEVNGERWNVSNNNSIVYDTNTLIIENLAVTSNKQSLYIASNIRKGENDSLLLMFDQFGLSQFNTLLNISDLSLNGNIDGDLVLKGFYSSLYFDTELAIDSLKINNQDIGHTHISSGWNPEMQNLNINIQSNYESDDKIVSPLTASGYFYPTLDTNNLDFKVNFDGFSLKSLQPFLRSFSSKFEGNLHGDFTIEGNLQEPRILGMAKIKDGVIKIDYSNTSYYFSDSIVIENQNIVLNNFKITDEENNIAYIKGNIRHQYLKNFQFDLSMTTDNLLIINSNQEVDMPFYGTIYAAANAKVTGTDNDINIEVEARTKENSSFNVPLNSKKTLKEQNFIQFVEKEKVKERKSFFDTKLVKKEKDQDKTSYKIVLNIDATPDIKVALPMDFSSMKALVSATGKGNLRLSLDSDDHFSMMGDYNIDNGIFKVDFINLLSRELKIENGGSVSWTGDPANAAINVKGIYEKRVSLSSLTGSSEGMENISHKTVNVESIISLTGNLSNPKIGFDFRLPNVDQSTEEEVYALIDRSNEREMINQTVSLLLTGEFMPVSGRGNDAFLSNGLGTGVDFVANQVSSIISNMIKVVDVNLEYKSQNELTSEQLNIDISKEWEKFYFETTFGWGGNTRGYESRNNIIGDMLLGYKITPYLHVVVFNRSNVNDYTKQNLPYTQGVGLKYTHSFDSWRNFFGKKDNNKKSK